ncbi:MAG: PIN domain-containing protein [Candidatus Solibacter usitatus]|nr:PIN domain-containing protein [Candidatus Solibacter usitatus]
MIDSSVLAALHRGLVAFDAIAFTDDDEIALASATASGLLRGVHRTSKPEQRARREAFVERLLDVVPVIAFDQTAARLHARLWEEAAARGARVAMSDLIIAATAMANGGRVATRDLRTFAEIPGLILLRC